MAQQAAVQVQPSSTLEMMMKKPQASSCCSEDMADLELALEPTTVPRQDSLYRDATRAGGGGGNLHDGQQDGWARTLRLAFQCVGVLYGDIGTSPLYVYSSTFTGGIHHTDDLLGVLSLIIYSFLLFTIIKYVYIALRANDDGDGGTFALYSLISRHAKVSLVPNHQAEDELMHIDGGGDEAVLAAKPSLRGSVRRRTVQLASPREQRAQWVKQLLETSKPVRISLFLLTVLATAMVISDACLTPAISVLSAVGGLKEKAPNLTTDQIVWMTVGILVLLFGVQRFGTHKVGYLFAPVVLLWLLLIGGVGVYNLLRHDVGVLRAFNPKYILDYFRRNGRNGWVSLGGVLLCFTGTEALFADLGYFSVRSIQLSFAFGLVPAVLLAYIGQAAFLRRHPDQVASAFYRSTPEALFWPTLVLALGASVVGSQAMISCAFATISHSQALGCFPRVKVLHTSRQYQGQLYIPEARDFAGSLVERLQYYVRDVNLYGEAGACILGVSYPSSRCDSMRRQRSVGIGSNMNMMMRPSASCTEHPALQRACSRPGVFAEEMLTPAESFSELSRMGSVAQAQAAKIQQVSLEEIARIEEEQRFIQREMDKGVVYILGEAEVVARPHSSLLNKLMVNYAYAFLRNNCRQGEKMLAIPKSQLLKVGITYEI
ncbi:hypothetical protein PVAP13_2KG016900 [Panicum virgatum]|uniref:Potassium transporter n=1 Tax=Panicum virgatum TaxID=38727 RepID=A0A8T0W417_PANVG|nr:hypothetical protein PVAP13_2KG016900 [Panicum virgatum]